MADNSVRLARATDADALGEIQLRSWRCLYSSILPNAVLQGADSGTFAEAWRAAVVSPPSGRHRVLVACEGASVVGFAAFGPTADPDLAPGEDAELLTFIISPDQTRRGHGSRLLAATVDFMRTADFRTAHIWLTPADSTLEQFITGAGWAVDRATRQLDLYGDQRILVDQKRLQSDIQEG